MVRGTLCNIERKRRRQIRTRGDEEHGGRLQVPMVYLPQDARAKFEYIYMSHSRNMVGAWHVGANTMTLPQALWGKLPPKRT